MSDTKTSSGSSIGFSGLLTLIFITLKLTNIIDWSWWFVLSPILYLPACYVLGFVFGVGIGLLSIACSYVATFFSKK